MNKVSVAGGDICKDQQRRFDQEYLEEKNGSEEDETNTRSSRETVYVGENSAGKGENVDGN